MKKLLLCNLLLLFNFNLGFSNSYNKSETLVCPAPTLSTTFTVGSNYATINWVENGTATAWQIILVPAGAPAPTPISVGWVYASGNPYVITGLNAHTSYDVYVRSDCGSEVSPWSNVVMITTLFAPPVCGGNYLDSGGNTANYENNANSTTTICPTNPGDRVTVTFFSFNTEASHDALYVFDGTSMADPQISSSNPAGSVPGGLAGGYWGNTIPGPFTSTAANGCLTFNFRSDATNTLAGWIASVDCAPDLCVAPNNLAVSNITNTSALLSWNGSSTNSEVLVVPYGSPIPAPGTPGVQTDTNPYIVSGLSPDGCYTAYVRAVCPTSADWSSSVDFCMFNCESSGDCLESLVLIAFLDANNNGIKDSGEINFGYGNFIYQVNDSGINQYGYGYINNGNYFIFDSNPANSYDISFDLNYGLETFYSCTASFSNITLPTGSGPNTLFFPVSIINPHLDAYVGISTSGQPRPGFHYTNYIFYQNRGTQIITSGTLTFTKDPNVSIYSILQPGTVATSDGFTYNFTNLGPYESRYISVELAVPPIPTVSLGQLITNNATIQINNDIDLSNNTSTITQAVVGSYDPNDKSESHGGKIVHSTFTSNDYLYYTIQFENTGTGSAEFIRVEDALDAQLDENTFEMLNASHAVNTKREGNQLTWHFYNINLPPTITNPADSHGFVQFRIKPKPGYAIGDIIPNTASIYFDYNPPIITNTFNTEFVNALGVSTFDANSIAVYPNPTHDRVTISNSNGNDKIASVSIYEVSGKRIYTLDKNTLNNISIDVSQFARGIYLMELISDNKTKITKKLLIK
jgi:hypothetical protein